MVEKTLGVIIGRFQVDKLTQAHRELIETVKKESDRVLVLVGSGAIPNTTRSPLPYEAVARMIKGYASVEIAPVYDRSDDQDWSDNVDRIVSEFRGHHRVTLFGGRDSFIPFYKGKYKTREIDLKRASEAATHVRQQIALKTPWSEEQKQGMIMAAYSRWPMAQAVVDVAILRDTRTLVLLGRKHGETKWRLPGGYVDPKLDDSYEAAARREAMEECGSMELGKMNYINSFKTNDYRYKGTDDTSYTALYWTEYQFGVAEAGDDLVEVKWFTRFEIDEKEMVKGHWKLIQTLLETVPIP